MDRRTLIAGTVAFFAAPRVVEGQPAHTARIGWVAPDPKPFTREPFRQALKELGWVEGQNLVIEERYAERAPERYPKIAADLVRLPVDILVTDGTPATKAAQRATTTIPVVFLASNAVEQGLVDSLSHPGRNLTGVAILAGDLNPKRMELLKEAVPGMVRLAILEDRSGERLAPTSIHVGGNWQAMEAAARQLGVQLLPALEMHKPDELDSTFVLAVRERAGGILVLPSAFFSTRTHRIAELAVRHRLAAVFEHRDFVEPGGLMSYGPSHRDMFRRVAAYVDRILKGARPAELPVEQPTKVELVINLKTAKMLGLTIPLSVLARADEVIQ